METETSLMQMAQPPCGGSFHRTEAFRCPDSSGFEPPLLGDASSGYREAELSISKPSKVA